MEFNPFDILPGGSPAELVPDFPPVKVVEDHKPIWKPEAKPLPASMVAAGHNGKNLPDNIGEGIERALAKRREGRASKFTEELAAHVIEGVEDGKTMQAIADELSIARNTIWTWMQLSSEFTNAVARAREYQGHAAADDAVRIIDDVDVSGLDAKQNMVQLRKSEQRARIRMDLAKAFNFKQYGDKKQNLNLNINAEVSPVDLSNYG
jgi:hypothetical protein